jgi:hypothetical protein
MRLVAGSWQPGFGWAAAAVGDGYALEAVGFFEDEPR